MNKHWFDKKRTGIGVRPSSWEGWLVTALFIFAMIASSSYFQDMQSRMIAYIVGFAILLIIIKFKYGASDDLKN